MNPQLGFCCGLAGWGFILFEIFQGEAGAVADRLRESNKNVQSAFATMRFIVTVGWAIYPAGYLFGYLMGSVEPATLNLIYNLADFVNKIALCPAIWASAKHRKAAANRGKMNRHVQTSSQTMRFIVRSIVLFACPLAPLGVYIDNTSPRHDERGVVMDIHDGGLFRADGQYWYYGIGYQNCTLERIYMPPQYCVGVYQPFGGCGFRDDHTLPVYSSTDLVRWRYEGDALPFGARPRGIYFRPKIIFDARTGEYVLWTNYLRQSPRSAWRPLRAAPV